MSEFQIGDRVVVLDNYPVSGSAGDEEIARRGRVGTVDSFGSLYMRVALDGDPRSHLFVADELAHYTETVSGPIEFAKAMREQADALEVEAYALRSASTEAYAAAEGLRALATFTLTVAGIRD